MCLCWQIDSELMNKEDKEDSELSNKEEEDTLEKRSAYTGTPSPVTHPAASCILLDSKNIYVIRSWLIT